jgi:serine/threonine-protein kinase
MGEVVAATHIELGHRVAIKIMLPGEAQEEQRARFLREARASVRLKTQHVAKVLDVGTTTNGAPYMIMEYLAGRDLGAELEARGPLPFGEAVELVLQACESVAEAHAAGIVHRDLKPLNLFLTTGADGGPCVKVLDFGISKVAGDAALTGDMALGSPLYMAPEQMRSSKDVDARADVWSLGVTLYHLVAGKTPFHAARIPEVCTRVFMEPPTPLATFRNDAPPGFEAVLLQCLEKDRDRRFPSVAALAAAIAPYAPARAVPYAERVAAVLGERIAPSRPTDVLPPEPTVTAAAQAATAAVSTGSALVSATQAAVPAPRRSRAGVIGGAVAALVMGAAMAAMLYGTRARPAASGVVLPMVVTATAVPPADSDPEAAGAPPDAGAPPAAVGSSTAPTPSAIVKPPALRPAGNALPRPPAIKTTPAPVEPVRSPQTRRDPYAE